LPTIVFLTVCTKDRASWLNQIEVHSLLDAIWRQADAWLVGRFVIMPDHIHLFVAPSMTEIPLDNWVRYWKSQFTKKHRNDQHRWQSHHWDRRLRRVDSYAQKWDYVRHNPVRKGLVREPDEWPYQGEIHALRWDE
jgi:REP element-mobilizing transposase RayT